MMTDVVIRFPMGSDQEADLFSRYLNRFMEQRSFNPPEATDAADAPYLIMHTDPRPDQELKIVTFQHRKVAEAFCSGWERTKSGAEASLSLP
jgi:hypothetical protein